MKNLLKSLGVIAVAGALGLQTANVYAAETCGAGYKEKTDYFMFLEVGSKSYYDTHIKNNFAIYTSADKKNNVLLSKVVDRGEIGITKGSRTTNSSAARTWTAEEYWKRYYEAGKGSSNNVGTYNNDSYVFHSYWYDHENDLFQDGGVYRGGKDVKENKSLLNLIENGIRNNNLGRSDLVTYGTSLPYSVVGGGNQFGTTSNKTVRMTVSRYFSDADKLEGVPIEGSNLIYSPAAYFVTYCEKTGEVVTPEKEFTVTYDGNGNDVVGVPNPDTVKENACFTVKGTPSRKGYSFLGWSSTKGAKTPEDKYKVGSEVCNLTNDVTLYAVWKKNEDPVVGVYTIFYDANTTDTVTGMPGNMALNVGEKTTISTMIPVRDGFDFLGWNTNASAEDADEKYKGGTPYTDGKDLVLYAIWKEKKNPEEPTKPTNPSKPEDPSLPENPKTAVQDYLLPLGGTAGISGACLAVLKKKKAFKQF